MQVLSLTLKGFRGIRDGLRRDTLSLDFEALAGDAALVAIAGSNGRGKTTVMDNMHPYLTMPSRAMTAGPGGFAYYDHVCLPESEKDLVWAHEGTRYRSQVVIRAGTRRRTEAFLFARSGETWRPVQLADGTVSDGKVETYTRCVEAVCGSADTFFTSVFSAQGKRQLSHYRNGEIKTLLADLLGQEEIRALGQKAADVARALKAGLVTLRQEVVGVDEESRRIGEEQRRVEGADARTVQALAAKADAQTALEAARSTHARLAAEREQTFATQAQRRRLQQERQVALDADKQNMAALDAQDRQEQGRLARLTQRIADRITQERRRREALEGRRRQQHQVLGDAPAVQRAMRALPRSQRLLCARTERVGLLRQQVQRLSDCTSAQRTAQLRLAEIEREAGRAALRTEELSRRYGLTDEVPCAGSDLQGRCKLLADAHEARPLVPNAQAEVHRLATEKRTVLEQLEQIRMMVLALVSAPIDCHVAEHWERLARDRVSRLAVLAARAGEIERVRDEVTVVDQELKTLAAADCVDETTNERAERQQVATVREQVSGRREQQVAQTRERLDRLDESLAALPAPFDEQWLVAASGAVGRATAAVTAAEQAHLVALRDAQSWQGATRQMAIVAQRRTLLMARIACVESSLGGWTLFARCMSNDGLIALAIDDAGPALSGLANDLLLACYGPRFTVSIHTLVETAKGEQKEGFDIVVHDGDSGESKSVGLMSGGERVFVNECLTRAVALYLAEHSGRRYATLFSDEADGALDAERKRMFMAMKREVLRLGGYEREFFVSQTPELTAMADAVIDMEAMVELVSSQ